MNIKPWKLLDISVAIAALALAPLSAHSQSLAYSNAIMSLSPVAYWPMHETNAPAPGDIETNLGTLGNLANGYYNDWSPGNLTLPAAIYRQFPGPFTNAVGWPATPIDYGIEFSNSGARSASSPYMMIPNVTSAMQLKPPFTIEWWANANYHQYGQFSSMVGPGVQGFNNSANDAGFSVNWNNPGGENGAIFNIYAYDGVGGNTISGLATAPTTLVTSNQWYYFAWVYTGNNQTYDVANGAANGPNTVPAPVLSNNLWSPFWVGNGRAGNTGPAGFSFDGAISELAIYTNALSVSDLNNHYAAGTNALSTPTTYSNLVMTDVSGAPIVYLRMNAAAYTAPAQNTWPVLNNYGTATGNGAYTPGTFPGLLTGSTNSGYPINVFTNQVALLSGMGTLADVGSTVSSSCNPIGSNANFTVTAMFRGNPADPRTQSIVGRGTNSWQLGLTTTGTIVFNAGNGGKAAGGTGSAAGDLATVGVYNDGFWHQVVAVNTTNVVSIYVDGILDTNGTPSGIAVTNLIPGNSSDALIGADPTYLYANVGIGRQLSGQICEVAFFNSALTPSQVQSLYNTSGEIPIIKTQPPASIVANGSPNAYTNIATVVLGSQLTYQWYFNTSSNYSGATRLANNTHYENVTSGQLTVTNLASLGNGYYYLIAGNSYGSVTSMIASLTILTAPQFFTQFPITYNSSANTNYMNLYAGANPTFSVSAAGANPLYYHWFTNGMAVGAATNVSLTVTNISFGTNSIYCVVTNAIGSATSAVWSASVMVDPTNSTGGLAPYPQQVLALKPIAYWRMNDYLLEGDNGNGDDGYINYDYAGGNDAIYTNVILGNNGYNPTTDPSDTSVEAGYGYAASSDANYVGTNIDFSAPAGSNAEFSVECWVNFNVTSVCGMVTKGWGNGGEEFTLDCDTAAFPRFLVRSANGTVYSVQTPNAVAEGSWYHLVGTCDEANSNLALYVNGQLAASTTIPTTNGILNDVGENVIIGARSSSLINDQANNYNSQTEGYINDVALFNYALSSNQVINEYLNSGNVAPFFTQEPVASTNVDQGTTLTISAQALGAPTLAYQWYETNLTSQTGFPLAGQSSSTLVINNVQTNDDYFLNVTNLYGSTNSSVVAVTVTSGLTLTVVPGAQTRYVGEAANYSAVALGTYPIYYQWFTNGIAVPNAISSTFTLVVPAGNSTVGCTVTNSYNGYSSSNVTVNLTGLSVSSAYQLAVLSNNPVAYWRLNEAEQGNGDNGAAAYDYAGGHNGDYNNTVLGFTGFNPVTSPDTAALFGVYAAANSYMGETNESAYGVPNINFGGPAVLNAEFSVECWVDVTNNTGGAFIAKGYGSGGEQFCIDTGTSGQQFRFYVRNAAGTASDANSSILPAPGNWYHLVGVCDEANGLVALYVDGVSAATTTITPGSGLLDSTSDTAFPAANLVSIGSRTSSSTATSMTLQNGGLINDVALYDSALSAAQVLAHYQASGLYVVPVNPNPTNIVASVTNHVLTLAWPADHTGWQLQAQTNSVSKGISTNWVNYVPSTTTNRVVIPINLTNGTVFYRLTY